MRPSHGRDAILDVPLFVLKAFDRLFYLTTTIVRDLLVGRSRVTWLAFRAALLAGIEAKTKVPLFRLIPVIQNAAYVLLLSSKPFRGTVSLPMVGIT
jgi:hypothetical protein